MATKFYLTKNGFSISKKRIAYGIVKGKESEGYTYLGSCSGWYSTRKGSNLYAKVINELTLDFGKVAIYQGAKKRYASGGWEHLIFLKP